MNFKYTLIIVTPSKMRLDKLFNTTSVAMLRDRRNVCNVNYQYKPQFILNIASKNGIEYFISKNKCEINVRGWNSNNYFTFLFIECLHEKKIISGIGGIESDAFGV